MKKSLLMLMLLVALSWSGSVLASVGQVWDVAADFSETSQLGTWSYLSTPYWDVANNMNTGYVQTGGTAVYFRPSHGGDLGSWSWAQDNIPMIGKNFDTVSVLEIAPGKVGAHPGLSERCVIRWTAPETGVYDVVGSYYTAMWGASDYLINLNATELDPIGTNLLWMYETTDDAPFSFLGLALDAGDTIDFAVGGGAAVSGDAVGIDAVITQVPEPATLLMLGLGALAIRRRIKR